VTGIIHRNNAAAPQRAFQPRTSIALAPISTTTLAQSSSCANGRFALFM